MAVRLEEYNGVCVLSVKGDFTGDDVAPARKSVEEQIDHRQITHFVVDLENVSFVDSQGLEALLWLKRRCEDVFGRIKLAGVSDNVTKILEVTRLSHRFEIAHDVAMALKTMR